MSEHVKTKNVPLDRSGKRDSESSSASLSNLLERLEMINRIQMALRSTLNFEDIYSIILASVISRSGFNFSRAILAEYEVGRGVFRGIAALGASSRLDNERIHTEIEEEAAALSNMVKELNTLDPDIEEEQFFLKSMENLADHAFWKKHFRSSVMTGIFWKLSATWSCRAPSSLSGESGPSRCC